MRKPTLPEAPKKSRASTAAAKPKPSPAKPRAAATRTRKSAAGFAPGHDDIAARAYDLFERSGRPHGRDVEFWLEAERQVKHPRKA